MTLLEAAKQALDYIKDIQDHCACEGIECEKEEGLVEALRQAIEQAEKQEPVAWISKPMVESLRRANHEWHGRWKAELTCTKKSTHQMPLYTAPPKPWVGLTDEEIEEGQRQSWVTQQAFESAAWWAEAKLKEKNGG